MSPPTKPENDNTLEEITALGSKLTFVCDINGTVLSCGGIVAGAAADTAALRRFSGRKLSALVPHTERTDFENEFARCIAAAVNLQFDWIIENEVGIRECELRLSPTAGIDAGVEFVVAELAVVEGFDGFRPLHAAERFEVAIAHAEAGWFERDLNTKLSIGSPSIARLYGLENPVGPWHFDEIRSRILPADRDAFNAAVDDPLACGRSDTETRTISYRIYRPDGEIRRLEVRYRNIFDSDHPRAHGLVFDVTDRARQDTARREIDQRLASIAQLVPGMVYQFKRHPDGHYSFPYVSEGIKEIYNLSPADVVEDGGSVMRTVVKEDRDEVEKSIVRSAEELSLWRCEYRVRRAGGGERWVLGQAQPVREEDGSVLWHGHIMDITERRAAEQDRERLNRQLQRAQRMEAIGSLTGGVAHDFNNILTSVLGYTGLAMNLLDKSSDPIITTYLNEVQEAGQRAVDLIAQLLAFSRGESAEIMSVELAPLLRQTINMLRPTLPSSIEISLANRLMPYRVKSNPVQLQQVIVNLCINARDALDGTGRITVEIDQCDLDSATCASCHSDFSGNFIALRIHDNGPGIQRSDRGRIFEPFFTTKPTTQGTGMGLAIVHGIVHAQGGHILLESSLDGGTEFKIVLPESPLRQPPPADVYTPKQSTHLLGAGARVLVVDDEVAVAKYVGDLLTLNGYDVTIETSAPRALEYVRLDPARFALVITDQTMPVLTGVQLVAGILELAPAMPIVIVTGYSASLDTASAERFGASSLLKKPIDENVLLETVAALVAKRDGVG